MIIRDINDNIISRKQNNPRHKIIEKCVFCNKIYNSPIDKYIDICPNCEDCSYEL